MRSILLATFVSAIVGFLFFLSGYTAIASRINELQTQITEKSGEIQSIEEDIARYQKELAALGSQKQTLEGEIRRLDLSRKKLSADISITERQISKTADTIEKIEIEIASANDGIAQSKSVLADTIQRINEIESRSLVEVVLATDTIADAWATIDGLQQFQQGINANMRTLVAFKEDLQKKKAEREAERGNLVAYKSKLGDQRYIIDQNRREQNNLLAETENKESNFAAQLALKQKLKEQFESEILSLESELRIAIDPTALPPKGAGVLRWPLASVFITQHFGNTEFAQNGGYNGKGHNGIDFRASIGTEVYAAARGKVVGTGNTDLIPQCYSYGKWVLVEHYNGLSTLYAHLSLIKVEAGQELATGDIVGYSGKTGYSTGPHLHFGVYATQGVRVQKFDNSKNCKNAIIPIAPLNAYLDPESYL